MEILGRYSNLFQAMIQTAPPRTINNYGGIVSHLVILPATCSLPSKSRTNWRSRNNNNIMAGAMTLTVLFLWSVAVLVNGFTIPTSISPFSKNSAQQTSYPRIISTTTTTTKIFMVVNDDEEKEDDDEVDFSNFEQELDDDSDGIDSDGMNDKETPEETTTTTTTTKVEEENMKTLAEAQKLKQELILIGASYDRGFGASASARSNAKRVIQELEDYNPTTFAAQGIDGGGSSSPLEGSWRMIWTTAPDVLVLGASPVSTVGAIYQVFDPPLVTNIIDFIPKSQSLLPSLLPSSLLRAEVTTKASSRTDDPQNRVGLNFESVKLNPVELLGQPVKGVLPPLGFNLPQIPFVDPETSPGYFDVTYLDDELLIIKQAGQGLFALVKVTNSDP